MISPPSTPSAPLPSSACTPCRSTAGVVMAPPTDAAAAPNPTLTRVPSSTVNKANSGHPGTLAQLVCIVPLADLDLQVPPWAWHPPPTFCSAASSAATPRTRAGSTATGSSSVTDTPALFNVSNLEHPSAHARREWEANPCPTPAARRPPPPHGLQGLHRGPQVGTSCSFSTCFSCSSARAELFRGGARGRL